MWFDLNWSLNNEDYICSYQLALLEHVINLIDLNSDHIICITILVTIHTHTARSTPSCIGGIGSMATNHCSKHFMIACLSYIYSYIYMHANVNSGKIQNVRVYVLAREQEHGYSTSVFSMSSFFFFFFGWNRRSIGFGLAGLPVPFGLPWSWHHCMNARSSE